MLPAEPLPDKESALKLLLLEEESDQKELIFIITNRATWCLPHNITSNVVIVVETAAKHCPFEYVNVPEPRKSQLLNQHTQDGNTQKK